MDLTNLVSCISFGVLFGINAANYIDATNWLNSHNIDPSYHEDKYIKWKEKNLHGKIVYYIGYPARSLAYKLHSDKNETTLK